MTAQEANTKALLDLLADCSRGACIGGMVVYLPPRPEWIPGVGESQTSKTDPLMWVEYGPNRESDREPLDPSWFDLRALCDAGVLERCGERGHVICYRAAARTGEEG